MDYAKVALEKHLQWKGKIEIVPTCPVETKDDLSIAYTPGVAAPCIQINKDVNDANEYCHKWNLVAVVTDGTAVLGLGDIGPEAGMPVMEGKSVLFKAFGDVDAFPICLASKDVEEIVQAVKMIAPTFGGINLEDISSPKCYEVENRLKAELEIPVFHDDQHGTAIACLAGVKGALRLVKKDLATAKIVVNGAGAAGANIARLLYLAGARDITLLVSSGVLHKDYKRLDSLKAELIDLLKLEEKHGDLAENAKGADILLGVSAAGVFTKEILENLADDAIVFAMANPNPEATYADMKAAGIRIAGTGRSDAPNQINNVAVFPGVFRGAIDVRASQITDEMKLAAADALAHLIPDSELNEENVMPSVFDPRVAPAVAKAVAEVAVKQGIAKNPQAVEDGSYEG